MSELSDKIRSEFKKADDERDALMNTPEDIERWDNIVYGHDDREMQRLDVYRPKQAQGEDLPVIISVHGGAWMYGDKERYQYYCMSLAQRGFAVVNFTYRLAPESKFPAQLEDVNLVCKWVMKRARKILLIQNVFLRQEILQELIFWGLYAAICTNPAYAAKYDFAVPEGFALTAIALNCGVYRIPREGSDNMTTLIMKELLPEGGTEEELESIDVLNGITDVYPPVFCMTSVADHQKAQAPALVQKLMENNVPFVYRVFGDKVNKLGHVFHCDVKTIDAAQCNDAEL